MNYIKFGKGNKTFVILPGLSIRSVIYSAGEIADAYKDFAKDYTVYVFDRPAELKDGCTIRELAEETAKEMKSIGIEKADIFGASQGGMMAQYIAADHPELVGKLVLGSTLARMNGGFAKVVDEWERLAEERNETALLESFADRVYSAATLKEYRDVLVESGRGITAEEYERFLILDRAFRSFDCKGELRKIKCPVLVLGCEGDGVVGVKGSKEIAKALKCQSYIYGKNFGHGVYDEAPDYRQRILDFLAEKPQAKEKAVRPKRKISVVTV